MALAEAEQHFRRDTRAARQRKWEFDSSELINDMEVDMELRWIASDRCMFCGASQLKGLHPHRFRPPQDAIEADGSTSRRHYWWLAYEWENIYLACGDCHSAQGSKFPVENPRVRVGAKRELNAKEQPLLIDPFDDDPEAVFIYLDTGEVVALNPRGRATIDTFDLNRSELMSERMTAMASVRREIRAATQTLDHGKYDRFTSELMDLYSQEPPFAALRRQYVNQWVQFRHAKIERALDAETRGEVTLDSIVGSLTRVTNRVKAEAEAIFFGKPVPALERAMRLPEPRMQPYEALRPERMAPPPSPTSYPERAEIRTVEIENFRAIERLSLEFPFKTGEGNWLMLLGENGAGKTSVLQALGLALCDEETRERLPVDPRKLLRHGAEEGRVTVTLAGSRNRRELRFGRSGLQVEGAPEQGTLIAGYGAMRLLLDERAPRPRRKLNSKIANLFDPLSLLVQPREWVPGLDSDHFDAVARALKDLLQLNPDQRFERSKRGLRIIGANGSLELADLSDGYKAMAVFALDMMQLFIQHWGTIEEAEGIVLVDELGAHLHPAWQMRVTESLRKAFRRVQFVATTHDPLCLRGLHDGEVVVLRRRGEDIYAVHEELPPVEGLAVDQLLTSEHFGLNSTLDPEVEELFTQYYDLLSQRRRSADEERALDELRRRLEGRGLLGKNRRERLALEATDVYLAEEQGGGDPRYLSDLKEETKQDIASIWRAG